MRVAFIEERNGEAWEVEYGPGCDDCSGLGAVFEHASSCGSDFCAGSGDEHSCNGDWLPCPSCGAMKRIGSPKAAAPDVRSWELTQDLTTLPF